MGSIHKNDLIELAEAKGQDSLLLLQNGRYGNAYYLAGYAVEIGLKAVIARQFQADTLPDKGLLSRVFTHRLADLIRSAGLDANLEQRRQQDRPFNASWDIVAVWSEDSRYARRNLAEATAIVDAVMNEKAGILPWLRTYW